LCQQSSAVAMGHFSVKLIVVVWVGDRFWWLLARLQRLWETRGGHGKSKIKYTCSIVKMDRLPDPPGWKSDLPQQIRCRWHATSESPKWFSLYICGRYSTVILIESITIEGMPHNKACCWACYKSYMKFQRGAKKYSGCQSKELDERKRLHHFFPKTSGNGQRYGAGKICTREQIGFLHGPWIEASFVSINEGPYMLSAPTPSISMSSIDLAPWNTLKCQCTQCYILLKSAGP
jgi:hypothetical protein